MSQCGRRRVSIRAPAKGATDAQRRSYYDVRGFDPRSREGSDRDLLAQAQAAEQVSIRAPAKGATSDGLTHRAARRAVSIRAPAKGATRHWRSADRCADRCFDPRSREGSDRREPRSAASRGQFRSALPRRERPARQIAQHCLLDVSIRAPAKGATSQLDASGKRADGFDPRSREGSDSASRHADQRARARCFDPRSREGSDARPSAAASACSTMFRSALPRRERPTARRQLRLALLMFRSALPRRERRRHGRRVDSRRRVSIRAPAKGATLRCRHRCATAHPDECFDPRSREGSDRRRVGAIADPDRFDPRSREGSDTAVAARHTSDIDVSIRAPAKGATNRLLDQRAGSGTMVSIRAPAKGATTLFSGRHRPKESFDPRSREGSDRSPAHRAPTSACVSIRAPAKGATPPLLITRSSIKAKPHGSANREKYQLQVALYASHPRKSSRFQAARLARTRRRFVLHLWFALTQSPFTRR